MASVVLVARERSALTSVAAAVIAAGGRAVSCDVDLTSPDAPARIVKAAVDAFGGIDVVVNAAGIIATGTIETTDDEAWDRMMALNLRGYC